MSQPDCIHQLCESGDPNAAAVEDFDSAPLSYAELAAQIRATHSRLLELGIRRDDRIAIVVPNGPIAATTFVCVSAAATTAPLNPGYTAKEYEFYLSDLDAKLLLVEAGSQSPALEVARRLGVAIGTIEASSNTAGSFRLTAEPIAQSVADNGDLAEPDDVALILHTSGTTSRPKMVPLTHANLCTSALSVAASLRLLAGDRCLNIMPLFHIHGLVAAVLASLGSSSTVVCSPGFNALRFYAWLEASKATWYTAVPTMHQAILDRAPRNRRIVDEASLRFVRSSSASLPPRVMAELETTFGAPVIEAYGMTEAAHQMTSNPLPPAVRKAGSVGLAAGPEVAVMNEDGALLRPGEIGEIVIRGANVTPGYLANPEANREAFTDGWFRTGDQGTQDEEGYLRLTGRLKEIINRGGEKISPREIDEVLLDHPAIAQVVTFAVPHPRLGEDVAAAVVLKEGSEVEASELRSFARAKLADFKVPRKVVFLDEIPKGPTGKLQRIGLAEKLGLGGGDTVKR